MDENINLGFKYSNEKHINDKIIQFSTSINHEFMIKLQALLINNKRIAEILSYSVIFYNNDGQYFFIPITTNKDDEIECLLSLNEIKKFNFGLKKLEEKYFLKSLYNYNAIDNIYYFPIILNLWNHEDLKYNFKDPVKQNKLSKLDLKKFEILIDENNLSLPIIDIGYYFDMYLSLIILERDKKNNRDLNLRINNLVLKKL